MSRNAYPGRYRRWLSVGVIACLPIGSASAQSVDDGSIFNTIAAGEYHFIARLRYEGVDDAAYSLPSHATTLRSRLNYRLPAWRGFSVFAEVDDIRALDDRYNSTRNGVVERPVVADPQATELNQATVGYSDERLTVM